MTKIVFPGSFDPITLGHVDLVQRAAEIFKHIVVAVAATYSKKPLFSVAERVEMAQEALRHIPEAEVMICEGLTAHFAVQQNAKALLRGVRGMTDFDYERQLAEMNFQLVPNLQTFFMTPRPQYSGLSSTLVREIAGMGGDVSPLVPKNVAQALTHVNDTTAPP